MSLKDFDLWAAGSVEFNEQGAPVWLWHDTNFAEAIVDLGTGIVGLSLIPGSGVDQTSAVVTITKRGTSAASGLFSGSCDHASDTSKEIYLLEEGAAGAVSVLANIPFDILIVKKKSA